MTILFRSKDEEIEWLRRRNRELEEQVQDLTEDIKARTDVEEADTIALKSTLDMPIGIARILRLLSSGNPYTRERMIREFAADFDYGLRNVDSQIKRIRKAVPWLKIETIYGYGYQLTPDSAAALRKIITEYNKRIASEMKTEQRVST